LAYVSLVNNFNVALTELTIYGEFWLLSSRYGKRKMHPFFILVKLKKKTKKAVVEAT